jgi:hypothetical protein
MGQGLYATDINCYHKMRMGWIKESHIVTMKVPPASTDSASFKPSDAERMTLVSSFAFKPESIKEEIEGDDKRVQCLVVKIPQTTVAGK